MSGERSGGIGLRAAALLVAGNMIGVGAFTTSGFALADLGSPTQVIVAWVVGGAIALCGALSYAGIAARLPGNGGEYLFLSRAVHPLLGFLAGWVSLFAGFTAPIAVAAHGFEAYLASALGGAPSEGASGLGALVIGICGAMHAVSRAAGLRLQGVAALCQGGDLHGQIAHLRLHRQTNTLNVTYTSLAISVGTARKQLSVVQLPLPVPKRSHQ